MMFSQPLPKGVVFFIVDVDFSEIFEYRFVDCSGNIVDAGSFTFLQISVPSANNPPVYSIQGTAPNRYWQIEATTAGNDATLSSNGIIIESDQVCGVQISSARTLATGGSSSNELYFFRSPRRLFAERDQNRRQRQWLHQPNTHYRAAGYGGIHHHCQKS